MDLKSIYKVADEIAPFRLSSEYIERYRAFDNSGILADFQEEICGALFSLDLSSRAVEEAKSKGAGLIITHHPAIFEPIKAIGPEKSGLFSAMKERISILSAHLNLDSAPGGIDEELMKGLGGERELALFEPLLGGGYGRVFERKECSFHEFLLSLETTFRTKKIVSYPFGPVKRVASFCGAGLSSEAIEFALFWGADTVVSSDGKHHLILEAVEKGLNLVLLPHYAAENFGFHAFYEKMKARLKIPCFYFEDERFL